MNRWRALVACVGVIRAVAVGGPATATTRRSSAESTTRFDAATLARVRKVVRQFKDTNHTRGVLVGIWSPKGNYVGAMGVAEGRRRVAAMAEPSLRRAKALGATPAGTGVNVTPTLAQ